MAAAKQLPLRGIRVLEFGGLAPGPYAGLILADYGADVIRIDRTNTNYNRDQLTRHKRSIAVNAKTEGGRKVLQDLVSKSDVIIDPFRPGVLERMQLGPDDCSRLSRGRAILARLAGYRRQGIYKDLAGHDLNYIALSGVLSTIRPDGVKPIPPNNVLGDYAGGGLVCALGVMMALFERSVSGKGQVVSADMVTGTRYVATGPLLRGRKDANLGPGWGGPPGTNVLDGGCPFYAVYKCADGKYISVAALEPPFYVQFIDLLSKANKGNNDTFQPSAEAQQDRSQWPALRDHFTDVFARQPRDFWAKHFSTSDACVAPVLEVNEVGPDGEANFEAESNADWAEHGGIPEPAPRLSRTPARRASEWYSSRSVKDGYFLTPGLHTRKILEEIDWSSTEIEQSLAAKDIQQA